MNRQNQNGSRVRSPHPHQTIFKRLALEPAPVWQACPRADFKL